MTSLDEEINDEEIDEMMREADSANKGSVSYNVRKILLKIHKNNLTLSARISLTFCLHRQKVYQAWLEGISARVRNYRDSN